MEKFTVLNGLVAPLDRANVDTDVIIPKQFLKSINRSGFGPNLFDAWRYLDIGEPGKDPAKRSPNPAFVLNQPRYKGATILLARQNFGCGSSREHAVWALQAGGFEAVVSPAFADIFRANALKNGLLPVELDEATHAALAASPGAAVTIDVARGVLEFGDRSAAFPLEPFARRCLLNGQDELAFLLSRETEIAAFEAAAGPAPWRTR
jgi:3-isopropylmalate/(R)-2-methylmalate dehydratase small subunit